MPILSNSQPAEIAGASSLLRVRQKSSLTPGSTLAILPNSIPADKMDGGTEAAGNEAALGPRHPGRQDRVSERESRCCAFHRLTPTLAPSAPNPASFPSWSSGQTFVQNRTEAAPPQYGVSPILRFRSTPQNRRHFVSYRDNRDRVTRPTAGSGDPRPFQRRAGT